MGAGWNLGNQLEAVTSDGIPNETAWGNPAVSQAFIQRVKASGFKTIRIHVSYLNTIGSAPDYTINSAWLARVKNCSLERKKASLPEKQLRERLKEDIRLSVSRLLSRSYRFGALSP